MDKDKTGDPFWTSGGHFVPMIGMDTNGNIITLHPAQNALLLWDLNNVSTKAKNDNLIISALEFPYEKLFNYIE